MVVTSTVTSDNITEDAQQQRSSKLVINANNFSRQDLENFINISNEIERRSQTKHSRSSSKTIVANMTREEIFESTNIDDDQFLNAMEYETTYDTEKNSNSFENSIEHLMKYFGENVNVKDESLIKVSPVKKFSKGKVALAVASIRNKFGFTSSTLSKRETRPPELQPNVQELRKKYENSTEIETNSLPKNMKFKSPKLSRKVKVKQMVLLFNNKIGSMNKNSSPEAQTEVPVSVVASAINPPKAPKIKAKFSSFITKLPNPKHSPSLKRKQLERTSSINYLFNSPMTKRRQLKPQTRTTCLVAENVFRQLSVRDKVLLYNKFIADMSNRNPKFSKHSEVLDFKVTREIQRGEVVFEKQNSVKQLRDCWEAKINPSKTFAKTLPRFKKSSSKLFLDDYHKFKEYEDILQTDKSSSHLEDGTEDVLHISSLTVVLKPSPESKKRQRQKKNLSSLEDVKIKESSSKRTQNMIRASFRVEPLAPPQKIRRHEFLDPNILFQNQHLEKLFYQWLKEKNGISFDIAHVESKTDFIEIIRKNTGENSLPAHEVEQILEAAIDKFESGFSTDKNIDPIHLIKNVMENEEYQTRPIIEVELPLEVLNAPTEKKSQIKDMETEDSDLGLASVSKSASEDSQQEFKPEKVSNLSPNCLRKKKLRHYVNLKKEQTSNNKILTDSDSDSRSNALPMQSYTLPKSNKCCNYVKNLMLKTSSNAPEQPSQFNTEVRRLDLNGSLVRQINSPSKIKTAYTLTIMSSPSSISGTDFYESDPSRIAMRELSRSWPSLLEASMYSDTNLLKYRNDNVEFKDLANYKIEKSQYKDLTNSFVDQGFETGSNGAESPLSLSKKSQNDKTKLQDRKKCSILFEDNTPQQIFTGQQRTNHHNTISPLCNSTPIKAVYPNMLIIKEDSNTEDSEERGDTPDSLNESTSFIRPDYLKFLSKNLLPLTQKRNSSQFWIASGDFTAAIAIHHYESVRLLLLSTIYAQKSLENIEINFGIDDKKFFLNSNATSDKMIRNLPKKENCSQYWFSTGNLLIPFSGKQMTSKKIHDFFNYILEFVKESGSIRFGIDAYEFSKTHQEIQNSSSSMCANTSLQGVSPLKTSYLDQSDVQSPYYEESPTFSGVNFNSTQQDGCKTQQIVSFPAKTHTQCLEKECSLEEMLQTVQNEQSNLKLLEEYMMHCAKTSRPQELVGMNESVEYRRKLRNIITAIENIDRSDGFIGCTTEQLESFMFFLSRYADMSLANSTAYIEKILTVVMSKRTNQS